MNEKHDPLNSPKPASTLPPIPPFVARTPGSVFRGLPMPISPFGKVERMFGPQETPPVTDPTWGAAVNPTPGDAIPPIEETIKFAIPPISQFVNSAAQPAVEPTIIAASEPEPVLEPEPVVEPVVITLASDPVVQIAAAEPIVENITPAASHENLYENLYGARGGDNDDPLDDAPFNVNEGRERIPDEPYIVLLGTWLEDNERQMSAALTQFGHTVWSTFQPGWENSELKGTSPGVQAAYDNLVEHELDGISGAAVVVLYLGGPTETRDNAGWLHMLGMSLQQVIVVLDEKASLMQRSIVRYFQVTGANMTVCTNLFAATLAAHERMSEIETHDRMEEILREEVDAERIQRVMSKPELTTWAAATGVVVRNDEGQVLVMKRADGLGFVLPFGFIGMGERPETAATRVLRSEAGIEVGVEDLVPVLTDWRGTRSGFVQTYGIRLGATIKKLEPTATQSDGIGWVTTDQLLSGSYADYNRTMLARYDLMKDKLATVMTIGDEVVTTIPLNEGAFPAELIEGYKIGATSPIDEAS